MERDEGNLFVLEGVLVALMLLGAAYGISTLQDSSLGQERPRNALAKTANDALVLLAGLNDGNGTLLDVFVREAMHCVGDATPSALQCDGERPVNLSFRLESYLPPGAGWAVSVSNGLATREIYRAPVPGREAVAGSLPYGPTWNGTFIVTELSCYEPGMDVNATLVPLDRAMRADVASAKASAGALEVTAEAASTPGWYNVTFPSATRPAASDVLSNVSGRTPFPGATSYASCNLGGDGPGVVAALRAVAFAPSASSARVGSSVDFTADLSDLDDAGATVTSASVTVYEPIGPRLNETDTWIPAQTLTLAGASATWSPDPASLYGTRPVLLRVQATVGGTPVELRRVTTIDVALPTGEVPIDAPYRAMVHVWMADWG